MKRVRTRYSSFRRKSALHIKTGRPPRQNSQSATPDARQSIVLPQVGDSTESIVLPQASDSTESILETSSVHELERNGTGVSRLCSECKKIDFDKLFSGNKSVQVDRLVASGVQFDPWRDCASCRLFSAITHGDGATVIAVDAAKDPSFSRRLKYKSQTIVLTGCPYFNFMLNYQPCYYWCEDRGFIFAKARVTGIEGQNGVADATKVDLPQINFQQLNQWLLQCDSQHEDLCGAKVNLAFSIPLSCIECHTRSIVHINEEDQYVALSYVWGTTCSSVSQKTRGHGESLPLGGVPQVIEDAIAVVIALGKRYLWVDQYCVNQLDIEIKTIQLREMDRVYAGAYVTIVASAGDDSDYGLPGISRKRNPRLFATLPRLELVTSPPALSVAIRNTKWRTRGWTYQEAVLSRRCLFFTNQQVYFACRNMSCRETDTDAEATSYHASHKIPIDLSQRIFRCEHKIAADTDDLLDQIEEYSRRNLTYEEDVLDAFRGLLNRSPFYTYWGIPIIPPINESEQPGKLGNMDLGFAKGLLWKAIGPLIRRQDFPSWSWVGWSGGVRYGSLVRNKSDKPYDGLRFWVEDADAKHFTFDQKAKDLHNTRMITEDSVFIVVEALVVRLRFRQSSSETFDVRSEYTTEILGHAAFFKYPDANEVKDGHLYGKIDQFCECIIMSESANAMELRILDWKDGFAEIIGCAWVKKLDHLPQKKEKIRLG